MLGDYIKKLTDEGYNLSFENPIGEVNWMCVTISKNGFSLKTTISPADINMSTLSIGNMLMKTIENAVGKHVLES